MQQYHNNNRLVEKNNRLNLSLTILSLLDKNELFIFNEGNLGESEENSNILIWY